MSTVVMRHRVLLAGTMSWAYAATLALLFAAATSGRAVVATTAIVAAAFVPLAAWSVRAGARNVIRYGPILGIASAAYILFVMPHTGTLGPYGVLLVAATGLLTLGLLPAHKFHKRAMN